MMREQTFLQLAPEFGGTKFGPFDHVEVRLGSDPSNSDITLPPTLGVADQHVKLIKQQDGSFIVAPVDRTAAVFHFRAGSGRPKQVLAPTAVSNGDSFALVTPEGPRFFILLEKDPRAAARSAEEAEGPRSLLQDPTLYIGLFFLLLILGQLSFYVVAFQQPSEALPAAELRHDPR